MSPGMVRPMMRRTIGMSASLLIAFALLAGTAAAQPLALATGEGGGQAAGQAQGSYQADATGALDEADRREDEAHRRSLEHVREANRTYAEQKAQAYQQASATDPPERPACECDRLADELEHRGTMQAAHTDKVQKAANVESEYVDAGADVGASGQAEAWFEDLFQGVGDAFRGVQSLLGYETQTDDEAQDLAEDAIHADEEVRGQLVNELEQDRELPDANPRADGEFAAEHASEASSSAVGQAQAEIP